MMFNSLEDEDAQRRQPTQAHPQNKARLRTNFTIADSVQRVRVGGFCFC
jgi:hypothetical protein